MIRCLSTPPTHFTTNPSTASNNASPYTRRPLRTCSPTAFGSMSRGMGGRSVLAILNEPEVQAPRRPAPITESSSSASSASALASAKAKAANTKVANTNPGGGKSRKGFSALFAHARSSSTSSASSDKTASSTPSAQLREPAQPPLGQAQSRGSTESSPSDSSPSVSTPSESSSSSLPSSSTTRSNTLYTCPDIPTISQDTRYRRHPNNLPTLPLPRQTNAFDSPPPPYSVDDPARPRPRESELPSYGLIPDFEPIRPINLRRDGADDLYQDWINWMRRAG